MNFRFLSYYFFDSFRILTFDLSLVNKHLYRIKTNNIKVLVTTSRRPTDTGVVD